MYYTVKSKKPSNGGRYHWNGTNELKEIPSPFILIEGKVPVEEVLAAGFKTFAYFGKETMKAPESHWNNQTKVRERSYTITPFANTVLYTITSSLIKAALGVGNNRIESKITPDLLFYVDGKLTDLRTLKEQCCENCQQKLKCLYNPNSITYYYCSPESLTGFEQNDKNVTRRINDMLSAMGKTDINVTKDTLFGREYASLTAVTDTVGFYVNEITADGIKFDEYVKKSTDPEVKEKRAIQGQKAAITKKLRATMCPTCIYQGDPKSKYEKCSLSWYECWKHGYGSAFSDEAPNYRNYNYIARITHGVIERMGIDNIKEWMRTCNQVIVIDRKLHIVAFPDLNYKLEWSGKYLVTVKRQSQRNMDVSDIRIMTKEEIASYKVSYVIGSDLEPCQSQIETYAQMLMLFLNNYVPGKEVQPIGYYYKRYNYPDLRNILLSYSTIHGSSTLICGVAMNQILYRYSGYSETYALRSWKEIVNTLKPINRYFPGDSGLTGIFLK